MTKITDNFLKKYNPLLRHNLRLLLSNRLCIEIIENGCNIEKIRKNKSGLQGVVTQGPIRTHQFRPPSLKMEKMCAVELTLLS